MKRNEVGKWNGNEKTYLLEALDSEMTHPSFVGRFEQQFREMFGAKYAIAHNSGTAALHTCLAAAGVGPGDEVIVPAQTVIMSTFAVLYQGATPVYADIDPYTFNISPLSIENRITEKTKAIIPVHMHGAPADMDKIMKIAGDIPIVEDAAQAILATYKNRLAGTIGDMGVFSFETKKHLSTGEGGMAITNDEKLATAIRKVAGLGYRTLQAGKGLTSLLPEEFQNPNFKRHDTLGWNYRMTEFTAAIGLAQLERLVFLVKRRQQVAKFFLEAIQDCDWIIPQKNLPGTTSAYWTFTVRYERDNWKEFYDVYKKNGGDGFYGGLSVVYQEPVMKKYNYRGYCPVAEEVQPKMMQFKTNYRCLQNAWTNAQILKKTIKEMN